MSEKKTTNILNIFNKAVNYINNNRNHNIDNDSKLKFYKFYKQATIGDINIDKPNILDIKNTMKWEAWNSIKKTSKTEAICHYIKLLKTISPNWDK